MIKFFIAELLFIVVGFHLGLAPPPKVINFMSFIFPSM